jgi:HD-like signal output (HDOD) protein
MKDTVLSKLEDISDLPTLSLVLEKLRQVLRDPDADAEQVSRVLEDDPSIVMRILRVVNSVYHGVHESIGTLRQAVACLGQKEVENIALTAAVLDVFPVKASTGFDRKKFWTHCISTGAAANVVSSMSGMCRGKFSPDALHLAGVIHDIGKVIYEIYFHHELMEIVRLTKSAAKPMCEVERVLLGTDHAETGGWLAKKWCLPEGMVAVIRWHHTPCHAPEEYRGLAGVCHLANYLCNAAGLGDGGDGVAPHLDECVFDGLGIDRSYCDEMTEEIVAQVHKSEIFALLD